MSWAANSNSELPGIINLWDIVNMESRVVADTSPAGVLSEQMLMNMGFSSLNVVKTADRQKQCAWRRLGWCQRKSLFYHFFLWNQYVKAEVVFKAWLKVLEWPGDVGPCITGYLWTNGAACQGVQQCFVRELHYLQSMGLKPHIIKQGMKSVCLGWLISWKLPSCMRAVCSCTPMALGNQTSHRFYVQGFLGLPWPPSYPIWSFPAYLSPWWWVTLALSGLIPNCNPLCIGSLLLLSCDTQNTAEFLSGCLVQVYFYVAFVIGVLPSGLVWALGLSEGSCGNFLYIIGHLVLCLALPMWD